ncbi:MAG: hypothetical protein IPM29_32630 [Planctomycetes bacterium]|nr:hypothetical protein [Planctomycetota bacterium]
MERWRSLQPLIQVRPGGDHYVIASERETALFRLGHWSVDLEHWPSRTGASLALAIACRALATAYRARDRTADIKAALYLARQLHRAPDWTHATERTIAPTLRKQLRLLDAVDDLIAMFEVELETSNDGPDRGSVETGHAATEPVADNHWTPSAHQQLVLKVLRRDGRLRTADLWDRIYPKHIEMRAHQNGMRTLVQQGLVLTDGKGRATEYWLP